MKSNFAIFAILLLLVSCVAGTSQKTSLASSSTDTENPTNSPSSSTNYFQKGSTTSSNIKIESNYDGIIYLRGTEVHNYIKNNFSLVSCSLASFTVQGTTKVLVTALRPKRFYNTLTNVEEYQYFFESNNLDTNTLFCNTPSIQTIAANLFPSSTLVFKMANICTNCIDSQLKSTSLKIYSTNGVNNYDITTSYLNYTIDLLNDSTTDSTLTCTTNETCTNLSYDCCSAGICVKNGALKATASTHPDYAKAMEQYAQNPATYVNWPAIFYSCETDGNGGTTDTTDDTDTTSTVDRLTELKELYECVNPIQGEMSVCTVRYSDVVNSNTYLTGYDDRNFTTTYSGSPGHYEISVIPMTGHSLYEVIYGGKTLYSNRAFAGGVTYFTITGANDSLDNATAISDIQYTPDADAENKDLVIRYTIDGSCTALSSTLAKCAKYYTQGQNIAETDDHFPASNIFKLPKYAASKRSIIVEVDGYRKQEGIDWQLVEDTEPYIRFLSSQLAVYDTQIVKITYYVETSATQPDKQVMQAKQTALDRIKNLCQCSAGTYCNLEPVYSLVNGITTINDYRCLLEDPNSVDLDTSRTIYFSSKSMPHRLFDPAGNPQADPVPMTVETTNADNTVTTSVQYQEGRKFEYLKSNLLKPNNETQYVGFNEIYGSVTGAASGATPAKEVKVERGHTYDLYTVSGIFSNCINCGTDYYSHLSRLFPDSFSGSYGGGYLPYLQVSQTDKFKAKYYRADDLKFGRACFVPATMIAWTHNKNSPRQPQRLARLHAQHFLYANGYQRDWYGFDYGSLIGSFDGVTWFAVGNKRRIKAQSDRLYLAINGAFSDLTSASTFTVKVVDITSATDISEIPSEDYETSAAECRKYHVCQSDSDCITQLGWDYMCEDISGIKTLWPKFDQSSLEIPNSSELRFLRDIIGNIDTTNGSKRCVYRGAGAPCHTTYGTMSDYNTFHHTDSNTLSACAPNYYCQPFLQGSALPYFNDRIARYGLSVDYKNSALGTANHTFGLASPTIGRPLNYIGKTTIPIDEYPINNNFYANNVNAICLPGKDVSSGSQSFEAQHSKRPGTRAQGDKVNGIGITPYITKADHYLSSCAILDEQGNYYYTSSDNINKSLNDAEVKRLAGSQSTSTNALNVFIGIIAENNLTKLFEAEQATEAVLEQNRCLRTAGSPCFTDMDCAPSQFVSDRLQEIDDTNSEITSVINKYEIKYWKEALICSQSTRKSTSTYDPTENRCCRETGKTLSIGTFQNQSSEPQFSNTSVAGIDLNISSSIRYTRNSAIYNEIKQGTLKALLTAPDDACGTSQSCSNLETTLQNQFLSFDKIATRSCCTGSWVRNFNSDENGGGHKWGPLKLQSIPKDIFKCLNWRVCSTATSSCGTNFSCDHVTDIDDAKCLIKATSLDEGKNMLLWLSSLELTGIPQIAIKGSDFDFFKCIVDYDSQEVQNNDPIRGILAGSPTAEYVDQNSKKYLSSIDKNNFGDNIKTVFSKDEVTCCLGLGEELQTGESANLCCTGYAKSETTTSSSTTTRTCALPDYSNVTVYFNRYISSEGKGLSDSSYDSQTGRITDPSLVVQLACSKKACASGYLHYGIALSYLKVPGLENKEPKRRWVDSNSDASNFENIADYYDAGMRWNKDVYCLPETDIDFTNSYNFSVINCGN